MLFPARAITAAHGWTYKILTESTYPRLMSFPKDRAEDLLRVEAGQAIANAMLAATDMGLGVLPYRHGEKAGGVPEGSRDSREYSPHLAHDGGIRGRGSRAEAEEEV